MLNYDTASGSYKVNSSKNTAPRGSTVVIFAPDSELCSRQAWRTEWRRLSQTKLWIPLPVTIAGHHSVGHVCRHLSGLDRRVVPVQRDCRPLLWPQVRLFR